MATLGGVPLIDFSAIGDLPKTMREGRKARREEERETTLADIGKRVASGELDFDTAAKHMAAVRPDLVIPLAQMQDARATREFNQGIATRQISLQERQAQEKPQYMKNDQGDIVEIKPYGGGAKVLQPEGGSAPANPFAPKGKQTEGEANASLYASRMMEAEKILRDPAVEKSAADPTERLRGAVPLVGNYLVGEKYQQFEQAQRNFINAVLRRESGAVINKEEFANAEKQYFPQPGDSAEKLAQKRANRSEAIRGIAAAGGKSFVPPYSFGQNGELVPNKPGQDRGQMPAAAPKAAPAIAKGRTATNPQTGQKIVFDGTQWVPVQ